MDILIADDSLTSRLVLKAILDEWGYQTTVACDGEEAWQQIDKTDPPRIAVIDWEMPKIDGLELCRKIKGMDNEKNIYVILLTGRTTKEDVVQGLDAGADDYITKPFDNNELRARIGVASRMVGIQDALAAKVRELQKALDHVSVLQGIIPICMHCNKIRNDNQAWDKIEAYISEHSDAKFSHSICPDCMKKHYPEYE